MSRLSRAPHVFRRAANRPAPQAKQRAARTSQSRLAASRAASLRASKKGARGDFERAPVKEDQQGPLTVPTGPLDAVLCLPIPPWRSLVPLVFKSQGLTLPESVTDGPPGPFGCIDALPIPPSRSLVPLVCARHAPESPTASAAARSRYFMTSSFVVKAVKRVTRKQVRLESEAQRDLQRAYRSAFYFGGGLGNVRLSRRVAF
jgi:hypothetical protein